MRPSNSFLNNTAWTVLGSYSYGTSYYYQVNFNVSDDGTNLVLSEQTETHGAQTPTLSLLQVVYRLFRQRELINLPTIMSMEE